MGGARQKLAGSSLYGRAEYDCEASKPFESYPDAGTDCAVCGAQQRMTPGGLGCANGHGGASSIPRGTWNPNHHTVLATPVTVERVTGNTVQLLDVGDEVSVTIGAETFCPIKFHAFVVGPVSVTVRVREGETGQQAYGRAKDVARAAWDAEFAEKLADHTGRVRAAAEAVENQRGYGGQRP